MRARVYLGGQQPGQVDLRHHLAPSVALPLVRVVVVFHQVPQFGAALQVRGDHGRPRAKAVGAAGRPQHALCKGGGARVETLQTAGGQQSSLHTPGCICLELLLQFLKTDDLNQSRFNEKYQSKASGLKGKVIKRDLISQEMYTV